MLLAPDLASHQHAALPRPRSTTLLDSPTRLAGFIFTSFLFFTSSCPFVFPFLSRISAALQSLLDPLFDIAAALGFVLGSPPPATHHCDLRPATVRHHYATQPLPSTLFSTNDFSFSHYPPQAFESHPRVKRSKLTTQPASRLRGWHTSLSNRWLRLPVHRRRSTTAQVPTSFTVSHSAVTAAFHNAVRAQHQRLGVDGMELDKSCNPQRCHRRHRC